MRGLGPTVVTYCMSAYRKALHKDGSDYCMPDMLLNCCSLSLVLYLVGSLPLPSPSHCDSGISGIVHET